MQSFKNATMEELYSFGYNIGLNMEHDYDSFIECDLYDDVGEIIEALQDESSEAWSCYTSISPFEFYAKDINEREDSQKAWQEMEEGFSTGFIESVEALRGRIVEGLQERRLEADIETLKAQWPEVKQMVVEAYSEDDIPALNEAFNDWTDSLCKNNVISDYTYNNVSRDDVE